MDFFEFAENLNNYPVSFLVNDIQNEMEHNEKARELQLEQWDEGLDVKGNILGRYSKMTEIITGGKKKMGDLFNINDTEQTRKNVFVKAMPEGGDLSFSYNTQSAAYEPLFARIGERLMGLQPKNIDQFTEIAQDAAIGLLNKNLKL